MTALDNFGLPALGHTGLFGVFLAAHAVPDALDVLHAGVGCKGKTQRHLVGHDLGRESHSQVGWTELSEEDLIVDAGAPLLRAIGELCGRRRPRVVLLSTSAAVDLTSLQVDALLDEAERAAGCPVVWLPQASRHPDLWAGYGAAVAGLAGRVDWSRPPAARAGVALVGHLFHRYEADQAADLGELTRLCRAVGLDCPAILLGGVPFEQVLAAHRATALVRMPHAGLSTEALSELSGRAVVAAGLPMGLGGCRAWLEALEATGLVPAGESARVLQREQARLAPRLALARRLLGGRRVAVMADTPAAAGWTALCLDLGMRPGPVVLLDRSFGGAGAFHELVRWAHARPPADLEILEAPGLRRLRALEPAGVDLCLRPDLDLQGTAWERVPAVPTGFPRTGQHGIFPVAELGFTGLIAQAQRLADALGKLR